MKKEDKQHKFKYKHIVNNKIVDMDNDHPYSGIYDKTIFIKMLAEDLGINESDCIDISENKNNLFRVYIDDVYYNISIEFTDGGGRDVSKGETHKKVAIPYHQKAFDKLVKDRNRVLVINVYVPLDEDYKPIIEERSYLVIDPKEIYNSEVFIKDTKHSSSRWFKLEELLNLDDKKFYDLNNGKNVYIVSRKNIKNFLELFLRTEYEKMITEQLNASVYNELINKTDKNYSKYRTLFREYLITERGLGCEISNCQVKIPELLIASHIKPVNKILKENITVEEKVRQIVDVNNGFLFCRNHDGLFDKFLISFDDNGVLFSSDLIKKRIEVLNIGEGQKYIEVKNKDMENYLKFHYKQFKKKSGTIGLNS